jgi:hypothetical protein
MDEPCRASVAVAQTSSPMGLMKRKMVVRDYTASNTLIINSSKNYGGKLLNKRSE